MSDGLPLLARGQPSIFACKLSRTGSSSWFFGARFWMMAASPAQNASGEVPVLGVASLAMKSNKTGAIFNPWASTRFMTGFLARNGGYAPATRANDKKAPQKAGLTVLFSTKPGPTKDPSRRLVSPQKRAVHVREKRRH